MRWTIPWLLVLAGCVEPAGSVGSWATVNGSSEVTFQSASRRALAVGDLDGDGVLEVATAGSDGDPSEVLTWDGAAFSLVETLVGDATDVAWGDLDGDGDVDLILGRGGASAATDTLYRNDDGVLVWWDELDLVDTEGIALADWNDDGDLDLARAIDGGPVDVWENDGSGDFTWVWSSTETGPNKDVAWADVDGDGWPDLGVARMGDTQLIYENSGAALTLGFGSVLSSVAHAVTWGDRDQDGDFEPTFAASSPNATFAWQDNGHFSFTTAWTVAAGDHVRAVAIGFDDSQQDPDLALAVSGGSNQVWRLAEDVLGFDFSLGSSSDDTWDVAWADIDGDFGHDLLAANLDGPLRMNRSDLFAWRGHWSSSESVVSLGSFAGDLDGDGSADVLVVGGDGNDGTPYTDNVYFNDGPTPTVGWSSPDLRAHFTASLADFDGDGDLDFATGGTGVAVRIWENTGLTFEELSSAPDTGSAGSLAAADVDGDGDIDVFQWRGGANPARVLINDGDGQLSVGWSLTLPPDGLHSSFGDLENDGDPDLALGTIGGPVLVYENDGSGLFSLAWTSPSNHSPQSVIWFDADGDGDQDLWITDPTQAVLYRRTPSGFTADPAITGLSDARRSKPLDWDGDGDIDVAMSAFAAPEKLWLNDGDGGYTLGWASQATYNSQALSPYDHDRDGDIDLFLVTSDVGPHYLWANHRFQDEPRLPNEPTRVLIDSPGVTDAPVWGFGVADVLIGPTVPVVFTIKDSEGDAAPIVQFEYSQVGGGHWTPATMIGDLTDLPGSLDGVQYTVDWDLEADGAEGDMLALRAIIPHQAPRSIAEPVQDGRVSVQSGWFRAYPVCFPLDADDDGHRCEVDCGPEDATIHPGAAEVADDSIDQDCNGFDLLTCFEDLDGDGFGSTNEVPEADDGDCDDDVGQTSTGGDCDDGDGDRYPGNPEVCDGLDNDCGGEPVTDELDDDLDGLSECEGDCNDGSALQSPDLDEACDDGLDNDCDGATPDVFDGDGDGSDCDVDCDDADADNTPGALEVCDGADNDCDGLLGGEEVDDDVDGQTECDGDCDDIDPARYIGNPEVCDGVDNDCDGTVPADELDGDGDGQSTCEGDCDDDDAARFDGNSEVCDGVDNDCDSAVPADELDDDGDGFSECGGDCNDLVAAINPGETDGCGGLDDDCDGSLSAGEIDDDGDGQVECDGDCDDGDAARFEGNPEVCDGIDNDCDGDTPDEQDDDGDGFRVCGGDCDDAVAAVHPGALELCDGVDTDCDGVTPDDELDADGDGFSECEGDCGLGAETVHPGAEELCNGVDDDCDGSLPLDEQDGDLDGFSPCNGDCDDDDEGFGPGVDEGCDGLDTDCDGSLGARELDGDGDGSTECDGDCDDGRDDVFEGATELCDLVDQDCDGDLNEAWGDADGDGAPDCQESEDEAPIVAPGVACSQGRGVGGGVALLLLALFGRRDPLRIGPLRIS